MDPTNTLNIILDGLEALEDDPEDQILRSDVALHLTNLAEWLAKGGAIPDVQDAFEKAGYSTED
jgi:hypothetical protein